MSKADNIQIKLDKAYGTVAKNLGRDFEIYRPSKLDSPLITANYLFTDLAAFSKDNSYKSVSKSGLSIWLMWFNSQLNTLFELKNGDMLYNSLVNETYIVVGMEPHLTHQAIKADDRLMIYRSGETGYGDDDSTGFAPGNAATDSLIATDVPCQILQPSSFNSGGYIPTQTNIDDAIPNFEIYVNDVANEIKPRDKLVDQSNNQSTVMSITQTDIGTKLTCRGIPE